MTWYEYIYLYGYEFMYGHTYVNLYMCKFDYSPTQLYREESKVFDKLRASIVGGNGGMDGWLAGSAL